MPRTWDYLKAGPERTNPTRLLPEAKSVIVVALPYARSIRLRKKEDHPKAARLARYALGQDYHAVLKEKLCALGDELANRSGRTVLSRACVDSAPLLERHFAAPSWNRFCCKVLLYCSHRVLGTNTLLGELIVDLKIPASTPIATHCGDCRACLDACPTEAFADAFVLDARRCISYLTIENRRAIPRELRRKMGNRVFGCDVCQDVCPFNTSPKEKPVAEELAPLPELVDLSLVELLETHQFGLPTSR